MPKLSKEKQKQRSDAILAAAERCFTRRGFHRTTMQDICQEANVSAGSIYVYFKSKEALIAGIAEGEQERILAQFAQLSYAPDLMSGVEMMVKGCVNDQTPEKTALFLELIAESTRNPEVREITQRFDRAIKATMNAHFDSAPKRDSAVHEGTTQCLQSILPVIFDGLMVRKSIDPDFDALGAADMFLQGLRLSLPNAGLVASSHRQPDEFTRDEPQIALASA